MQPTSFLRSRTFWGVVVLALLPVGQSALAGHWPSPSDVGTAIGGILAAAGATAKAARIEAYVAQAATAAQSKQA